MPQPRSLVFGYTQGMNILKGCLAVLLAVSPVFAGETDEGMGTFDPALPEFKLPEPAFKEPKLPDAERS